MDPLIIKILLGVASCLGMIFVTNVHINMRRLNDKMDKLNESFLHHLTEDAREHGNMATQVFVERRLNERTVELRREIHEIKEDLTEIKRLVSKD